MNILDLVNTRATSKRYPLTALLSELHSDTGTKLEFLLQTLISGAEINLYNLVKVDLKWYVEATDSTKEEGKSIYPAPSDTPLEPTNNVLGCRFNKNGGSSDVIEIQNNVKLNLNTNFLNTVEHVREGDINFTQFLEEKEQIHNDLGSFYMGHIYDKRGRLYCKGHHVNYQGDSYLKASVLLAEEEVLTEQGRRWLLVDLANHSNSDISRKDYYRRYDWSTNVCCYQEHRDSALEGDWKTKPQFTACLQELALNMSKPTGYMVGLDAGASGLQIMSVLTNNEEGCRITGLIGDVSDAYEVLTDAINEGTNFNFTRKEGKEAIMPFFYGSKKTPKAVLGLDGFSRWLEVLNKRLLGPSKLLFSALKSWNKRAISYDWTMPDTHQVFLPVTQMVNHKVVSEQLGTLFMVPVEENRPQNFGLELAAHITHSCDGYVAREMVRRLSYTADIEHMLDSVEVELLSREIYNTEYDDLIEVEIQEYIDAYEDTGVVSVGVLDVMDGTTDLSSFPYEYIRKLSGILLRMSQYRRFDMLTVHDEFKCHANHCNRMSQEYQFILSEFVNSSMLEHILNEIEGNREVLKTTIFHPTLAKQIQEGKYGIN